MRLFDQITNLRNEVSYNKSLVNVLDRCIDLLSKDKWVEFVELVEHTNTDVDDLTRYDIAGIVQTTREQIAKPVVIVQNLVPTIIPSDFSK